MARCFTIRVIKTLAILAAVSLLANNAKSFAQDADIKAAIDAYHSALGARDISKMQPLWSSDDNVTTINPRDKKVSVGPVAVQRSFEADFAGVSELKVTQSDGPYIQVRGNVAWSTGIATAQLKLKSGESLSIPTYEMDVFEKRDGRWLLASHTALSVPQ
jgi:ketosteroid isomerase-like protein